ncbi:hypothetical protein DV737_g3680, partial [Chaetothyriales sp. CBS 132003]
MARFSLFKAVTLLSTITSFVFADSNSSSICSTSSTCVPFTIDVTAGELSAAGFSRQAILVNGTYPGPALNLKVGDCVDFVVINNLDVSTSVHFHGIRQKGTPYSDGAAGLTQYPIPAGETYQYQWTAESSGVYFYHAHYKGQMMDGLIGAIIIQSADGAEKPFSQIDGVTAEDVEQLIAAEAAVEPIFVSDWSRYTFDEFFAIEQAANIDSSCTDALILNGKGAVYCPSIDFLSANGAPQLSQILNGTSLTAKGCIPASNPLVQGTTYTRTLSAIPSDVYDDCTATTGSNYTYTVDPSDGWAALSFINSGGLSLLKISIDSHKLYIYEFNGNYITPQYVDEFVLGNGDRISFAIQLNQSPGNYQIRVANDGLNQVISGFGVISYSGASTQALSGTAVFNYGGFNSTPITIFDPALAAPYPSVAPAATVDKTFVLDIEKAPNLPYSWAWTLTGDEPFNHTRDDEEPLLFQDPASIPDSDLILKTNANEWVDLIIKISGPLAQPHPIHKHANKFFVIGSASGDFNFTTTADAVAAGYDINLDTAPYVDGYTSTPAEGSGAWMIFRYQANTPGAWFLHCHVQSHFSGGMAVAILDGVDDFPSVPSDAGKVCPGSGSSNSSISSGSSSSSSSSEGSSSTSGSSAPTSTTTIGAATYTGAASSVVTAQSTTLLGLVAAFFVLFI